MKKDMFKSITLAVLAFVGAGAFASFKVCGQIEQRGDDLVMVQDSGAFVSPIYSRNSKIEKQLSDLVGFREVCVQATSDEGDIVVSRIISRSE